MSKIFALWPDGSYSSKAAKKVNRRLWFTIEYKDDISSVIEATVQSFYWLIPMHNTYGWVVKDSYEGLVKNQDFLRTLLFVRLQIDHCLASAYGESIWDIKTVYSHPQALKQCEGYLNSIWIMGVATNSTSEKIHDLSFGEGIICSTNTAQTSWLQIIDESVTQDDNITIFALMANKEYSKIFMDKFNNKGLKD